MTDINETAGPGCPYLGLAGDPGAAFTAPSTDHRCYATASAGNPGAGYQAQFCLTAEHANCPLYAAQVRQRAAAHPAGAARPFGLPRHLLPWLVVAALFLIVAGVYAGDLLLGGRARGVAAQTPVAPRSAGGAGQDTAAPAASARPRPTLSPRPSATLEPGVRTLTLEARAGDAGWWTSGEARGNHLGDSFLYAGYTGGQAFVSAARIELAAIGRGSPILGATIRLTGLNAERLPAGAAGAWQVQLLPESAVAEYARAGFQTIYNAPAAVTLFPQFSAADLGTGTVNAAELDESGRAWLEEQLNAGAAAVIVRITGPAGGDALFAWDSGAGPSTAGEGPALIVRLGSAPANPPPLPTEAVIVATATATAENILTVAAQAMTATAAATRFGTPSPAAFRYVTPTPSPANLATAQALALLNGQAPIVEDTPTPANDATATAEAALASARVYLTGTPTAPPRNAVTPIYITQTPTPANIFTEAARILTATALPARGTPLPYNAVIVTPRVTVVVTPTPRPANAATATARAAYATAVAIVHGTPTPWPWYWVTATSTP